MPECVLLYSIFPTLSLWVDLDFQTDTKYYFFTIQEMKGWEIWFCPWLCCSFILFSSHFFSLQLPERWSFGRKSNTKITSSVWTKTMSQVLNVAVIKAIKTMDLTWVPVIMVLHKLQQIDEVVVVVGAVMATDNIHNDKIHAIAMIWLLFWLRFSYHDHSNLQHRQSSITSNSRRCSPDWSNRGGSYGRDNEFSSNY